MRGQTGPRSAAIRTNRRGTHEQTDLSKISNTGLSQHGLELPFRSARPEKFCSPTGQGRKPLKPGRRSTHTERIRLSSSLRTKVELRMKEA